MASFALVVSANVAVAEQAQSDVDQHYYAVNGLVEFFEYRQQPATVLLQTSRTPARGLRFEIVGTVHVNTSNGVIVGPDTGTAYQLIDVYEIKASKDPYKGTLAINSDDNLKHFAMPKDRFDKALADGYIQRRALVAWKPTVAFGAVLALPFKLRPRIEGHNRDITTDVTLGGYVGPRWRISPTKPFYLNLVFTAGLTLLPMNNSVTPDADAESSTTVPGLTVAGGVIFTLDSFQIGFLSGRDYASGDLGARWIYNTKQWFSLSVGFTFLKAG